MIVEEKVAWPLVAAAAVGNSGREESYYGRAEGEKQLEEVM